MAESFVSTLKAGADSPSFLAKPSEGEDGDLRVHRGLLQHPKEAFRARASEPLGVRGG